MVGGAPVTVHLVGAGPGDPGLLTVRAAELLRHAEVVVHDRLVDDRILGLAAEAELIDVGKAPHRENIGQADINALLVELGRAGRETVRLKGGDPFVFGRGGEEAAALAAAGVAFTIVPGVSAAFAAPAAAGIPVTQRQVAQAVTVVTGHIEPGGDATVDWEAIARVGGTIVVLMGAGRIGALAARLQAAGLAPGTPLTAVRWATRPDQEVVRATLAGAADLVLSPPCTIVIGAVAALDLRSLPRP
jgi:uroporphyrin-III C-methyltransferase